MAMCKSVTRWTAFGLLLSLLATGCTKESDASLDGGEGSTDIGSDNAGDTDGDTDTDTDGDTDTDTDTDTDGDTDTDTDGDTDTESTAGPSEPAVSRGGTYFGFDERFNRYYTDKAWQPDREIYVSPDGRGSGNSREDPTDADTGLGMTSPGARVTFLAGTYSGCFELDESQSGTYDAPIVLYGERSGNGALGVTINCCNSGRRTCLNFEGANYIAVDGFELIGGYYGVRSVGLDYASDEHQVGIAVLRSDGHEQSRDPFFTGQSDWYVIEGCTAHDVGTDDGHGIYLSNGSDWNIARFNETYNTSSSDFQINADPISTCDDIGIAYDDPECDAVAGDTQTGGRGASDFMWIEGNYFHHSGAQGPNFTSVRNSRVFNNVFAFQARHGASFWQETDNPRLGASHNLFAHNLLITTVNNRRALGFGYESTDNTVVNNIIAALSETGGGLVANEGGQLLATESTSVDAQHFEANLWISGFFGSEDGAAPYEPNAGEYRETNFDALWFENLSAAVDAALEDFRPSSSAPWLDLGALLSEVPFDRMGQDRSDPSDLGPFEE